MTGSVPTTLYVNVRRDLRRTDHIIVLNKHIDGSRQLDDALAAIGNGGKIHCGFGTTAEGNSIIKMAIMSGSEGREAIYSSKLCDIVTLLARETGTEECDVMIHIEKAVLTSLSELRRALDLKPGRAYEITVDVRELDDGTAR